MGIFDIDAYFRSKALDNTNPATPNTTDTQIPDASVEPGVTTVLSDKLSELAQAAKQKVQDVSDVLAKIKIVKLPPSDIPKDSYKNTWVSKADPINPMNPDGLIGNNIINDVVNSAARLTENTSRVAGNVLGLPEYIKSRMISEEIPPEIKGAYDRYTTGQADAIDMELLNSPSSMAHPQDNRPLKQRATTMDGPNRPATYKEILDHYMALTKNVKDRNDAFDMSNIVDRSTEEATAKTWNENTARIDMRDAYNASDKNFEEGNTLAGMADWVKGTAHGVGAIAGTIMDNPRIIPATVGSNAAQTIAGLINPITVLPTTIGYASQLDVEGKMNQLKETGKPFGDLELAAKRTNAADIAGALEFVDQMVPVTALKNMGKVVKDVANPTKTLASTVSSEISDLAKKGAISTAVKTTGKEFVKVPVVEGITENLQSPLEDFAQSKPYDVTNRELSTVMGVAGGIGHGTGPSIVTGLAEGKQVSDAKKVEKYTEATDYYSAVKNNDPSKYLDENSPTYNPATAASVLAGHAIFDSTPDETRQENLTKLNEIKTNLESQIGEYTENDASLDKIDSLEKQLTIVSALQEHLISKVKGTDIPAEASRINEVMGDNPTKVEEFKTQIEEKLQAAKAAEDAPLVKTLETQLKRVTLLQDQFSKDVATSATQTQTNAPESDLKASGTTAESRVASLSESMGINDKHAAIVDPLIEHALQMRKDGATAAQTLDSPEVTKGLVEIMRDRKDGDKSAVAAVDLLFRRVDQIHAETGSLVTNQRIASEIANNRNPELRHALDWIATDTSDPGMAMIAGVVSSVVGDTPIKFDSTIESGGVYDGVTHQISINSAYQEGGNVRGIGAVVLHEGTHAATMKAIYNNEKLHKALFDLMEHVAEQDPKLLAAYGMKTTLEFLSEGFSNKAFQEQLHAIKASNKVSEYLGETIGDAWNQFVTLVREALNIPAEYHSSLTQLLELGGRAMKETQAYDSKVLSDSEVHTTIARGLVPNTQLIDTLEKLSKLVGSLEVKNTIAQLVQEAKDDESTDGHPVALLNRLLVLIKLSKSDPDLVTQDILEQVFTESFGHYSWDTLIGSKVEGVTSKIKKNPKPGQLSVFNEKKSPEGTEFKKRNLIRDFFSQKLGSESAASVHPLVAAPNFLSQLREDIERVLDFLKAKTLEDQQWIALNKFVEVANKWNPIIEKSFFKEANSDYYYKNLVQLLIQAKEANKGNPVFTSEENLKTALSYGAFTQIIEMAGSGKYNNNDQINAILGRQKDTFVHRKERELLGSVGIREALLYNSAGKVAYQALGFKANNAAYTELEGKLQAALGTYVLHLLVEEGLVTRHNIKNAQIASMMGVEASRDSEGVQYFFSLSRDKEGELLPSVQSIVDSVKGSQNILDKLFSVESNVRMPQLTPFENPQSRVKNTEQSIPSELEKILEKKRKEINHLRDDLWDLLDGLSNDAILRMAGMETINANTPADLVLSRQAKNDALQRELNNYFDLGQMLLSNGDKDLSQAFYLDFNMWITQRVGISTNGFNPQGSKLHRQLSYQPSWETVIDINNKDSLDNFFLRIAEGLGVKTDAKLAEDIVPDFRKAINKNPLLLEAVELLRQRKHEGKKEFTPEEEEVIVKAVKQGKENLHSLNSLMGLADFRQAKIKGETTFTVQLPAEVDGKVNGAMLSSILFGVATTMKAMNAALNRGGFFELGNRFTQFNAWKANGNWDLYENTIKNVWDRVVRAQTSQKDSARLSNVQYFTGILVNDDGTVESVGRKLIKRPTTEITFGSATTTTVNHMADTFVEKVYEKIEEVARNPLQSEVTLLIKNLNALMGGVTTIDLDTTIQEIVKHEFSKQELIAMKKTFIKSMGQAVQETVDNDFAVFIERRNLFNKAANSVFARYKAAYDFVREQYIEEKFNEGIAISTTHRTDNETNQTVLHKVPLHDLTSAQEAEVRERVAKLYPTIHSIWSSLENDQASSLAMLSNEKTLSNQSTHTSEVRFNTPFKDTGSRSIRAKSFESKMTEPGVSLTPFTTHSLDSYISHMVQKTMDVLNVHDALVAGFGNIREAAQKLNKATWDALMAYSPLSEMFNSSVKSLEGVLDLLNKESSPEFLVAMHTALKGRYKGDLKIALMNQLLDLKRAAAEADRMKYTFLNNLQSVDQYTFEGGAYEVTAEDRAAAKAKLEGISDTLTEKELSLIDSIAEKFSVLENLNKEEVTEEKQEPVKALWNPLSNAQTLQLIHQALKTEPTGSALKTPLQKIFDQMVKTKEGFFKIVSSLASNERAAIQAYLTEKFNGIPSGYFGVYGKSQIESDPYWTGIFEKHPNLSGKNLISLLRQKITQDGGPKNIQVFNLELLKQLEKTIHSSLTIRYVTPATAPEMVIQKAKEDSRAWFVSINESDTIYVLSPEFKNSGVTTETMMHELLHAALARTMQVEREKQAKNPKYTSPVLEMMDDLEKLRQKALAHIVKNPELARFMPALEDIDELVSWGMTNLEFQREVLNKVTMQSKTKKTTLDGMKALIETLVGILFGASNKSRQAIQVNGMSILISNVSGLFTAAQMSERQDIDTTINQSQRAGTNPIFYTSTDIFQGLGQASMNFQPQLNKLLTGIVNKLYGDGGTFHDYYLYRRGLNPQEVFDKVKAQGFAPFATKVINSPFVFSEQEQYVMDQVEATVRAVVDRKTTSQTYSYDALVALYNEAHDKLNPRDFFKGDWNNASVEEKRIAQEKYDFLFGVEKESASGDRTNHLSKFVAMGLANEEVSQLLGFKTKITEKTNPNPKTLLEKLQNWFDDLVNWIYNKIAGIKEGQQADERLNALMESLVSIEDKKRRSAIIKQNATWDSVEAKLEKGKEKFAKTAEAIGNSPSIANNPNGFIRTLGGAVSKVAAGKVDQMIEDGLHFHAIVSKTKPTLVTDLVSYVRGPLVEFEELFRLGKHLEGIRKNFITQTAKSVLAAFEENGANLTPEQSHAISALILRGDMQRLYQDYSMDHILGFLRTNSNTLTSEIAALEAKLTADPNGVLYIVQARALAHHMMVGGATVESLMLNAHNIAMGYGTELHGVITEEHAATVEKVIDPLVSLYAIKYANSVDRVAAYETLKHEMNREDGTNGIEVVMKLHQYLQEDSKAKLFDDSKALIIKGYTPEVYNPRTQIQIANEAESKRLTNEGWSVVMEVPKDPTDVHTIQMYLMVLRDVGIMPHPSGAMSTSDQNTRGSATLGKNRDMNTYTGKYNQDMLEDMILTRGAAAKKAARDLSFNPELETPKFMVPVLNPAGEITNYRYTMREHNKDSIFERNNNFEHLLGVFAGNTFDKVTSAEHNKKVVKALHDFYEKDWAKHPEMYVQIGIAGKTEEHREIYRLLPEATKRYIESVWGPDGMMVRYDMLNLIFGYRKYSLSNMWDKEFDQRNSYEQVATSVIEYLLAFYARNSLGKTPKEAADYAKRAAVVTRRAEDSWKYFSDQVKSNIVVKTGKVMIGNIWSNITLLMLHGIPMTEILSTHATAFRAARLYQEDSEELFALQNRLDIGVYAGTKQEMERKILILKDRISRNPVTEMMDAGLMPTIVRDIDFDEDKYAYKPNIQKKIEKNFSELDPLIQKIGKQMYMTKDTKTYQMLADVTQLSDFVARYTLYQHLIGRSKNPMPQKEALRQASESFVNYDIPLPRGIQYVDDMGILPFTKYFLSMQRILLSTMKDHPLNSLMVLMANRHLHLLPSVMDSFFGGRLGNNPIYNGPIRMIGSVTQILPIKLFTGLMR